MSEVVLVPEWKLPLIVCPSCKMKFFVMAYIGKLPEEQTEFDDSQPQIIPQCKVCFCPNCGKEWPKPQEATT